jgi:hypothetical protein
MSASPSSSSESPRQPVTGADVDQAVRLAVDALAAADPAAWDGPAGTLEWTCWETAEHLADDLMSYAAQIAPRRPPQEGHIAFAWERQQPEGPPNAIHADRTAGPAGLLQLIEACGALLSAVVRTAPPEARAFHIYGVADPEGFAAMGVVETLVHTSDLAGGLGLDWAPPAGLCARVLARLFPDAPRDTDPWATLLWATGRGDLPGHPRLTDWRWYAAPPGGG